MRILVIIATLVASSFTSTLLAYTTCSDIDINLTSQADVDNFQRQYGGGGNCEEVSNNLRIERVSNLTNLDGLQGLKRIGGDLKVNDNDFGSGSNASNSLTDITGLRNIESVGGAFELTNNHMLADCSPVAPLLGYPNGESSANVGRYIVVIANADGCNSVDEVFASVSPEGNNGSDSFKVTLEEPAAGLVHMGVGNLRGWALSSAGIRKVTAYLDGALLAEIPYGGTRGDVGAVFPDISGSERSGFSMSLNYSGLSAGNHTLEVVAESLDSNTVSRSVDFQTIRFDSEYIGPDELIDLNAAASVLSGDEIRVENISIAGRSYNLLLRWRTTEQGFEIVELVPLN